jgi:hypothetical protein
MMDKDLKAKWVAELRGGKYKQAHDCLRGNNRHCCLGVLCDIIDPTAWNRDSWKGNPLVIPLDEAAKVGLSDYFVARLADMNDTRYDFSQIADYIERKL